MTNTQKNEGNLWFFCASVEWKKTIESEVAEADDDEEEEEK